MVDWKIPAEPALRGRFLARAGGPLTWPASGGRHSTCDLFWARNALHAGLGLLHVAPGSTVLVPAYVCRSVPESVLAYGARVEFYRIDEQCRLDLDDIAARIRAPVSAVIAVHYFGLPQRDILALRTLCDQHRLLLIEDCAHVLPVQVMPGRPGFIGHASIFSWRKFLPVFDGGTLVLGADRGRASPRPASRPARLELRACKDVVDRRQCRAAGSARRAEASEHRAAVAPSAVNAPNTDPGPPLWRIDANGDAFRADAVGLPMTLASRWIRDHSDLSAVAEARRRNWHRLAELLPPEAQAGCVDHELPPDLAPWVLPLRLHGSSDPCRRLRERGIPAAAWSGVRPATLPVGLHPEADRLYEELVFLPVHQDLREEHLELLAQSVRPML